VRRTKRFEVFTTTINLFSSALIGYLFRKCVFIQYIDTGEGVYEFGKFTDENGVKTFNFMGIGVCCQCGYFEVTDSWLWGSLS